MTKKKVLQSDGRIQRLKLKKLNNTRDLGGLPAADGRTIKYNRLIRSGRPYKLPEETVNELKDIGVSVVVDLRIELERKEHPSTPLPFAETKFFPLLCTATDYVASDKSMVRLMRAESKRIKKEFGSFDEYMLSMYEKLLFLPESKQSLSAFLRTLVEADGCVMWNCSAGKDRTGVCAMLIEGILGVSEDLIVLDYTMSETFQRKKRTWQKIGLWIMPIPAKLRSILITMMKAKRRYIYHVMQTLDERYGGITEYCKAELGLTESDVNLLKAKYLE